MLSESVARAALEGGPRGRMPVVGGSAVEGADIEWVDSAGEVFFSREVKAINLKQLGKEMSSAFKSQGADELWVLLTDGSSIDEVKGAIEKFRRQPGRNLDDYRGNRITIVDADGSVVHSEMVSPADGAQ